MFQYVVCPLRGEGEVLLGRRHFTLRKLVFHFLSHCMRYDRGDSFPLDFEQNGFPFGSEIRKENCHHNNIPFNLKMKWNTSFLSVACFHEVKYFTKKLLNFTLQCEVKSC